MSTELKQEEVTDSMIREAFLANGFTIKDGHSDLKPYVYAAARAILALRPTQVNTLAGCNCRWDGDNQVEWCELHLAHKEAIHEWAERAKSAEQKLALRPVQVPMTDEQMRDALRKCPHDTVENLRVRWLYAKDFARAIEAHHGIKPKEQA